MTSVRAPGTASIESYTLASPAGWAAWQPRHGESEAGRVARALGANSKASAQVEAAVLAFDGGLADVGAELTMALWVPDPETGDPWGLLVMELLAGSPDAPASASHFLAQVAGPRERRGVKVLEYSVAPGTIPAGESVVQVETTAPTRSGQVVSSIIWTVFPRGCQDALRFTFSTPSPAAFEALGIATNEIMDTLTVTLEVAS